MWVTQVTNSDCVYRPQWVINRKPNRSLNVNESHCDRTITGWAGWLIVIGLLYYRFISLSVKCLQQVTKIIVPRRHETFLSWGKFDKNVLRKLIRTKTVNVSNSRSATAGTWCMQRWTPTSTFQPTRTQTHTPTHTHTYTHTQTTESLLSRRNRNLFPVKSFKNWNYDHLP